MMTNLESLLALNSVPTLGAMKIKRLLEHFGSPQDVLNSREGALQEVQGITAQLSNEILHWENHISLQKEISRAERQGIGFLTILDDDYPENLKNIYDPPIILYVKGEILPKDKNSMAVVGTRRPSIYGQQSAVDISRALAYSGMTVISGLAIGIDSAAHRGALEAQGRTIAVLGGGFDQMYPSENKDLADEIASTGAVITEYPMSTRPDTGTFPRRNRIISGLSLGTLIVEASRNSGALITAGHALDQNRLVFAIPGRIDLPTFAGNHRLIKQGAKLVEKAEDILSEFEYLFPGCSDSAAADDRENRAPELQDDEITVFDLLSRDEKSIDEIIEASGMPPGMVSAVLVKLEMKKLVRQFPGKLFARTR